MPLTIVRLKRERTLAAIAKRVYRIEGPQAAELTRGAEAALLAANPPLRDRAGFKLGATVVVPNVAGLRLREAATAPTADAATFVKAIRDDLDVFDFGC